MHWRNLEPYEDYLQQVSHESSSSVIMGQVLEVWEGLYLEYQDTEYVAEYDTGCQN